MQTSKNWSTTARYFVLILVLGALLWLAVMAGDLIGPLAISALLAYVINPLVIWVNRHSRLSRKWVVLLAFLGFLIILIIAGILIAPIIPRQITNLADQLQTITIQVESVLARPLTILNVQIPLDVMVANWPQLTQDFTRPDLIINALVATSQNLIWILVVLVTAYYLLLDWNKLREWMLGIVPDDYKGDAERLYREVRRVWNTYSRGQLRLMFVIGLITGLASAAIGLPGAFALGVLAGLLDILLTVGPLIVMVTAAIVAFVAGSTFLPISNFWFMILVIIVYAGIQVLEYIWLRPRIVGAQLRLHPAIVFVSVISALAMAGVLTALIIVPLISSAFVIGRYLYCKISNIDPWAEENNQQSTDNSQQFPGAG
jgi:predicted PurR-regulated permease PerM